jgi:hypothetical protein
MTPSRTHLQCTGLAGDPGALFSLHYGWLLMSQQQATKMN